MEEPEKAKLVLIEGLGRVLSELGAATPDTLRQALERVDIQHTTQDSEDRPDEDTISFLKQAVSTLQGLLQPTHRDILARAVNVFGIAARKYEVHDLLRQAGVLQFALETICALEPFSDLSGAGINWLNLRFETWRLLANISANDDSSREAIISSPFIKKLISEFGRDATALASSGDLEAENELKDRCRAASSALFYNLLGYDPARQYCQENGLIDELNNILRFHKTRRRDDPSPDESLPSTFWDLLEEIMTGWDVEKSPRDFPGNILEVMIYEQEVENEEEIFKIVASHLGTRTFSSRWASSEECLRLLLLYFYNLQSESHLLPSLLQRWQYSALGPLEQPQEQRSELKTTCLGSVADITEQPEFLSTFDISLRPDILQLVDLLAWPGTGHHKRNEDLIECVCMILGNYALSEKLCLDLTSNGKLIPRLMDVLQYAEQYSTQYMATKLLKNLAIPEANKAVLCKDGFIFQYLARGLKESVRGELLQTTISTARILITPESVMYIIPSTVQSGSFLESLLSLTQQVDDQGIKVETGRFLKRFLQCAYKESDTSESIKFESRLTKSLDLFGGPLAAMILQKQNAVVRSEGWLALAILARAPQGANIVADLLSQAPIYEAMQHALALRQEQVADQEEKPVYATDQQQRNDQGNIRLLLKALADHKVTLKVENQDLSPEKILSPSSERE